MVYIDSNSVNINRRSVMCSSSVLQDIGASPDEGVIYARVPVLLLQVHTPECSNQEDAGKANGCLLVSGSKRFASIRFGSGLFGNSSVRFGLVRKIKNPCSTRFGLRFSDVSWLGPVRFCSVPRLVPAGSRIEWFGSVRFCRFGSVSYSFLLCPAPRSVLARPEGQPRAAS